MEISLDQYDVKWITRSSSSMKVVFFTDLTPAPRQRCGVRHTTIFEPQFPHSQRGNASSSHNFAEKEKKNKSTAGIRSALQSNTLTRLLVESLPARMKLPTQEMKPERKELKGKVPTRRQ